MNMYMMYEFSSNEREFFFFFSFHPHTPTHTHTHSLSLYRRFSSCRALFLKRTVDESGGPSPGASSPVSLEYLRQGVDQFLVILYTDTDTVVFPDGDERAMCLLADWLAGWTYPVVLPGVCMYERERKCRTQKIQVQV
jgi:hypothetical protein